MDLKEWQQFSVGTARRIGVHDGARLHDILMSALAFVGKAGEISATIEDALYQGGQGLPHQRRYGTWLVDEAERFMVPNGTPCSPELTHLLGSALMQLARLAQACGVSLEDCAREQAKHMCSYVGKDDQERLLPQSWLEAFKKEDADVKERFEAMRRREADGYDR